MANGAKSGKMRGLKQIGADKSGQEKPIRADGTQPRVRLSNIMNPCKGHHDSINVHSVLLVI